MYEKTMKLLNDLLDTVNNFLIVDEDDTAYYVVVNETAQTSLNQSLVSKGLAMIQNLHPDYRHWNEDEFEAKSEQRGIWEDGGAIEDDEN